MKSSFDENFLSFRNQLKSYLFRLTANREETEDLAQDVYIKAVQCYHTFNNQSNLKTWVFAIATNLVRDRYRFKQRWKADTQDVCRLDTQADENKVQFMREIVDKSAYEKYEFREHIDYCFTCITKTLIVEQQLVIILKDVYEFKISDIMQILDLTEGRAKHLLSEARKNLEIIFDERCVLVSKKGICHQCSEINGFVNPKQDEHIHKNSIVMVQAAKSGIEPSKLLELRTELIRGVDPLNSISSPLHEYLLELMPQSLR